MERIIEISVIISFAIVGLRIVSSKGMILHFLRMPYEWLQNPPINRDEYGTMKCYKLEKYFPLFIYILKPILGCCTCMSSVWTVVISYFFFELSQWTILLIFMVAFLNSIFMALYEKLSK